MQDIKLYTEEHCEQMISDLAGFINIPSISNDLEQVERALDYILKLAEDMGLEARSVLDHRIGLIELGEGEETIGILSHIDVVPPGDLSEWKTPPFEMTRKDGKLFGRGTIDDKGAIIASLYAMKYVKDTGLPLKKKIQMILGTQEEVEWTDMEDYVKEFPLPDYGFTPDGEFPVCNIEKGCMDLVMHLPVEQDFGEDGWYVTKLSAGVASNTVPGRCEAVIARVEAGSIKEEKILVTSGESVHSCQPENGKNAIFPMAQKLKSLNLQKNRLSAILSMIEENFSSYYGKELGLYNETEYYQGEFVHRNVFSPTLISMDGGEVHVNINVRFAFGADEDEITERIKALAGAFDGSVTVDSCLPAVYVSKDRPFMKVFADAYTRGCGEEHEFVLAYGGSYAKAMPGIVSWGPIFPGEEDMCHKENEYISVESLLTNCRIFADALAEIALSEESYK